ncbi:BppU family phage baseplate upper protein [Enterococcus dongliensis]|uniref:BppU family phage baseplate upper protein n=1 Tax=Enterococcus dongliensis TaxID=2559925 RepID=UPI00288E6471|nr:BppU family phage baseplate upper protein [Enterococcus dongliensis]MDT2675056.1 BppU family phage baseplate upper protein [Enterococcus dongliensis]
MFKTNEEIIVIQAKATTPIPTGVVFWSHDKGTAKLIFQLKKDGVNQTLPEGTIVPICLDFVGGRHIYHAVIEDAVNGIVSIVLEDNILGYVGRVTGSIYIELPDSRSLDTAGRFTFDIKRSPIDLNTPELEDYYWQGFNQIMNQYHQTIAEIETESERLLNELQARILTLEEKLAGVELRARFKTAWSWSADGTDRFTKVYPRENLFKMSFVDDKNAVSETIFTSDGGWGSVLVSNENLKQFLKPNTKYSVQYMFELLSRADNTVPFHQDQHGAFLLYSGVSGYPSVNLSDNVNNSEDAKTWVVGTKRERKATFTTPLALYDSAANYRISYYTMRSMNFDGTLNRLEKGKFYNIKFEEYGGNTIYTPSPSEDPINAYPTYKGISIVDSDNPADYSWQAEDNTIAKKATLDSHTENISNPHKVTKTQIGLGNVDNYSTATQAEAEAGTATNKFMTPALVFKAIAKWVQGKFVSIAGNETIGGIKNFKDGLMINDVSLSTITRKVIYEADGVGEYFNAADKFTLGASGKIDKIVLLWSRVDDTAGTLLNYSWSQTVLSPDDLVVGNSYRIQMTTDNYKFVNFANESGNVTISGANENSVAPNRIYRIKRIIAYLKN